MIRNIILSHTASCWTSNHNPRKRLENEKKITCLSVGFVVTLTLPQHLRHGLSRKNIQWKKICFIICEISKKRSIYSAILWLQQRLPITTLSKTSAEATNPYNQREKKKQDKRCSLSTCYRNKNSSMRFETS